MLKACLSSHLVCLVFLVGSDEIDETDLFHQTDQTDQINETDQIDQMNKIGLQPEFLSRYKPC
jgi:hypothetical protein